MKYLRIELHTCENRSQTFLEPILVQLSSNNGILWKTLTSISYRPESPRKPWLIQLSEDESTQGHLVRLRLFQRVTTSTHRSSHFSRWSSLLSRMGVQLDLEYIRDHPRETTHALDRCEFNSRSPVPFEVRGEVVRSSRICMVSLLGIQSCLSTSFRLWTSNWMKHHFWPFK